MAIFLSSLFLVVRRARLSSGNFTPSQFSCLHFYSSFDCRFPLRGWQIFLYKIDYVYISGSRHCGLINCWSSTAGFPYEGDIFLLRCLSVLHCCICILALWVDILSKHHGCTRMPISQAKISEALASM